MRNVLVALTLLFIGCDPPDTFPVPEVNLSSAEGKVSPAPTDEPDPIILDCLAEVGPLPEDTTDSVYAIAAPIWAAVPCVEEAGGHCDPEVIKQCAADHMWFCAPPDCASVSETCGLAACQ
jgi:hypothetical protein